MINTLETGGSERQFVTIAGSLDPRKFSVSVGCLRKFGPLANEVDGLYEFPVGGKLFGIRSWRSRLALRRFLLEKRIQVAHSFDFYSNLMLIPAARLASVPVVGSHRQLGDLMGPAQFKAQSFAFRFSDRVVCNSQAAAKSLRTIGREKITVIPNGLPEALFAQTNPLLPREQNMVRIGMIARMNHPAKGHEIFLRAARKLTESSSELQFVLVGDGHLRPRLEELSHELGIASQVLFLGDRHDIPSVLTSLDISVLPSTSESLSNVIMESMAAGLPVVATDVGGNPELVRHGQTGFLFSAGDEIKFAESLQILISQPELRKQLGANARLQAHAEYSISHVRDQYQELYRSLLAAKGRASSVSLEWQTTRVGR
jgi:glycosyltransferase involved in cell wall biosynthesis